MGGPGPSSRATSMKVAGTPSFNSCVFSAKPERKKWSETGQHYSMQAHADLKGGEWSLPRLAYMTKRLKYCCRWRPCSDTSLLSRLSTARNKCSLKLKLSQLWDKRTNNVKRIRTLWSEFQISDIPWFPMNEGSLDWRDVPDLKVQVKQWVKGRVHLAGRNVQWIQWVWRRLLEPLHWDTQAGTPRSGLDMQRGRCAQTSNAHSYCVVARCTEHHTWNKRNEDQLIVDKRGIN